MPFKSKAQMRLFFAKEKRGELPKGTAKRWAHETPSVKKLPEKKKKSSKKASATFDNTITLGDFIKEVYLNKLSKQANLKAAIVKLKLPELITINDKPLSMVKDKTKSENAKSGQKLTLLKGLKLTTGKK